MIKSTKSEILKCSQWVLKTCGGPNKTALKLEHNASVPREIKVK